MSRLKVKGQGHQGQKTRCALNTPAVWTEWNALVADNVAQAAGATIRSLQRGVRDACRIANEPTYILTSLMNNEISDLILPLAT